MKIRSRLAGLFRSAQVISLTYATENSPASGPAKSAQTTAGAELAYGRNGMRRRVGQDDPRHRGRYGGSYQRRHHVAQGEHAAHHFQREERAPRGTP